MQFRDADEDDRKYDDEEEEEEEDEEELIGEDDWEEAAEECFSLFDSARSFPCVEDAMKHDCGLGLDLAAFSSLSVYDRIKVVNWIRTTKKADFALHKKEWDQETFLKPVLQEDPYLTWSPEFNGSEQPEQDGREEIIDERLKRELLETQEALEKQGLTIDDLRK